MPSAYPFLSYDSFSWRPLWDRFTITACMVVPAVVKANSKVKGKGQISTPGGSETPERILMKPKLYNYVADTTTHANPCGGATMWVLSENTWQVTCFGFLGDLLLLLSAFYANKHAFILLLAPSPHGWTDFDDLDIIWRVSAQGMILGWKWHRVPFRGSNAPKTPHFGLGIGVFNPNA